jgi:hypothetical protein
MLKKSSQGGSGTEPSTSVPLALRWLRAHGLRGLTPWHFIDPSEEVAGLRAEYRVEVGGGSQPERDFLPFARRQDQDDVAGFVIEQGTVVNKVISVHLTWSGRAESGGFPSIDRYSDIWEWLKEAIDETARWCSEEDLPTPEGDETD